MEVSYTDETTISDSITLSPASTFLAIKSPESLCRVRSSSSVVLDYEYGVEAESRKLPSSRFKGVVAQPNGRWGAQIYEKHQRVWLGTFNEEEEAAKVYDIAAQRFRGRDAVTNFKHLSDSIEEEEEEEEEKTEFLNSHSKAEIVDMLRKRTYSDELIQSRKNYGLDFNGGNKVFKEEKIGFFNLFEKTVTPSDVGKLNRLVIPKQYAEKHFPLESGRSNTKGLLLNFEDVNGGKVWRFRYSYWNSSQSYVFTKGWSRFVKEKNLKAGDIVRFMGSTGPEKKLFIDWKGRNGPVVDVMACRIQPVQMVRLFGVNIFKVPGSGKRMREMELLGLECSKKQRVIDAL